MPDSRGYVRVNPGTSNAELREIAEEYGLDLDSLWRVRAGLKRRFEQSVDSTQARTRRSEQLWKW